MTGDVDLSRAAELIADRARSRILVALTPGRELSASLLAEEAGVSRPTASAHLKKLTEGGLITVRAEGKSRHYRLAGPAVADVLERLMELAPPEPITSLRASTRAAQLRRARSCYDHLAGRLGVGLMTRASCCLAAAVPSSATASTGPRPAAISQVSSAARCATTSWSRAGSSSGPGAGRSGSHPTARPASRRPSGS
jgi:DNA-binding transcriptional ArsR family regulator